MQGRADGWWVVFMKRLGFETPILVPSRDTVRVHRAMVLCSTPGCRFVELRRYGESRAFVCKGCRARGSN